jgi:hypothetical protein
MISFLAETWFLWWMFAVLFILRWVHVLSANSESDGLEPRKDDRGESRVVSGQLA